MNRQINEEAAHWFVEFRTGDMGAAGRRDFDVWVRASPEHLRAFLEIAALWGHSDTLDRQGRFPIAELTASACEASNVVPLSPIAPPAPAAKVPRHRHQLAIAAAVLLMLVAGSLVTWSVLRERRTYSTEVGERRSLRLADGSTVTLNSRSRARIEFNDTTRAVALLQGEALFRVAREASRPFLVRAEGTSIRAVGTEFDVDKKVAGAVVTVVEGRVAVTAGDKQAGPIPIQPQPTRENGVLVSAGERLDTTGAAPQLPTPTNTGTATAWIQGRVILQSVTLEEVAERFSRYSQRRLLATDHGEIPFRLSGTFSTDPDFLIRYLRERPDIEVRESATEIRIIRAGPR